MFFRKLRAVLTFWKNDFLHICLDEKDEKGEYLYHTPDLYGPVWMIVTYVVIVGLAANLNDYFSLAAHNVPFYFQTPYLTSAIALNLTFRLIEIFLYPAVMGCLDA
jgi:hypothetical protein